MEAMGITEEMLSQQKKIDFGKELTAHENEAKAWATIWSAGQGVTSIHDSPSVAELVASMKTEFTEAIKAQYKLLETYK